MRVLMLGLDAAVRGFVFFSFFFFSGERNRPTSRGGCFVVLLSSA